jgi:carboxyl-terminal processing protease
MGKGERPMVDGRVMVRSRQVRILSALCLLAALSLYPLPITPSPVLLPPAVRSNDIALVSTATSEGRLAVFDDAWARINERYYDQTFHGLDWEAQKTTFRTLAAEANSSAELYGVLRRMIGSLDDPHTRVFAPDEKFDWWRPRFLSVGFATAEIAGMPTVIRVDPDSAAQRAGIRAGDVIIAVNGEPAHSVIANRLAKLPDPSSVSARFRAFAKLLDGPGDTAVEILVRGKDGKQKSVPLYRRWQQRELGVRVRREQDRYAVVELEGFTKSIAAAFGRNIRPKLEGARGVILDLRANGGGDAEAMSEIASTFLGVGANLGQFTDRGGTSFTIFTHGMSPLTADPLTQTRLPVIVLTSERTASAAEILVEALRDSKRATIIGRQTCGCVLAVRTRHLLPDGGVLDVSELDYETAQGMRLEGHGLKPDETVAVARNDLYTGRDRAMELALNKLAGLRSHITSQRANRSTNLLAARASRPSAQ